MSKRIDSLSNGDVVALTVHPSQFNEGYVLKNLTFDRIEGSGDDRRAVFSEGHPGSTLEIYRYNKRWAIASDARRVTLAS